jgi:multidrug resistance efflux pump
MFKRFSILLSIVGLGIIIYVVATSKREIPNPPPAAPPSVNPFPRGIAGLGLVETAGREVDVAAPESGRVVEVFVEVGLEVKPGDPLFRLDDTILRSDLLRLAGARDAAAADLARLEAWPRQEDIPALRAAADEARSRLRDAENRYQSISAAAERNAATQDELDRQRFAVDTVRAAAAAAQANLDKYLAGPWKPDLEVGRATLAQRAAELQAIELRIENLTVRAPRSGTILKRNIEPGEYAASGMGNGLPPIVLGDLTRLQVRAQVDEEDAPMLRLGAEARARVRGQDPREVVLKMVRIEPLALPKSQITNSNTELIDTRVVEVIFDVVPGDRPTLYPGQVVDVFISAAEIPGT